MFNGSSSTILRRKLQPAEDVAHVINASDRDAGRPGNDSEQAAAPWSDKMALRIWIACGLVLWLLGFINLVTGMASR
jgi:hypothetical protein